MKLQELPNLPINATDVKSLYPALTKFMRETAQKVNQVSSGTFAGYDGASTAAPTTGTWAQGDFVLNSNPTVLGAAASQYTVLGFLCVAGGTPGTWVQFRGLTGT